MECVQWEGRVQPERSVWVVQEEEDLITPLNVLQAHNCVPPLQVAMETNSHQRWIQEQHILLSLTPPSKSFGQTGGWTRVMSDSAPTQGNSLKLWILTIAVKYPETEPEQPLVVVKGTGTTLLGRNWMEQNRLEWQQINLVQPGLLEPWSYIPGRFRCSGRLPGHNHDGFNPFPMPTRNWLRKKLTALFLKEFWNLLSFWVGIPHRTGVKERQQVCGDFKQTINPLSLLDYTLFQFQRKWRQLWRPTPCNLKKLF